MHFGNISFYWEVGTDQIRLAPAYDMLPMLYAPVQEQIVDWEFQPSPPNADAVEEWRRALPLAVKYWKEISLDKRISEGFKLIAKNNLEILKRSFNR
jgi:hypothetical protein